MKSATLNLATGTEAYLQPGEVVAATLIASVRGHQQAMAGGIAGAVGGSRSARSLQTAAAAGIRLASPMGLVLTSERLLTVRTGGRGVPQELLGAFPLSAVAGVQVRRVGLGAAVTITINGVPVRLEARVTPSRAFAAAVDTAKSY